MICIEAKIYIENELIRVTANDIGNCDVVEEKASFQKIG